MRQSRGRTIDPARAKEFAEERAATTVGSPVVLDGNLEVVTSKKTKAALVKAEKAPKPARAESHTAPEKPVKVAKPARAAKQPAAKPALNPNGHAWITPDMVVQVFADKAAGMKNAASASKHNIGVGSVSTILSGPEWFRQHMAAKGMEHYPEKEARSAK